MTVTFFMTEKRMILTVYCSINHPMNNTRNYYYYESTKFFLELTGYIWNVDRRSHLDSSLGRLLNKFKFTKLFIFEKREI